VAEEEKSARGAFRRRELSLSPLPPGTLLEEEEFRIESVVLDHGTPCLAFAFQEQLRINVWREGLDLLQLPVGAWLNEAKRAVRRGAPDDSRICMSTSCAQRVLFELSAMIYSSPSVCRPRRGMPSR
jgi:hypothetical protein